ncbi:membrane-spanning 4-domains subfamily A member 12 [Nycticebus coucang]|uniref:membrane-spanning 4-domains subfamily A member 12 n=1 Tax=Nycticebus coucang TaxID=9470 RepID=UPI00234D2C73|nr:membrane-spanning 4-domains subfamily A member 12 [Nycticebus coucang]
MMSSKPTSHPKVHDTIPNPYPASSFMALRFQQPPGSINKGNQAQGDQPPFIILPGIVAGSHRGQENTQMINPALGIVSTNFTEEAKALGAIQIIIGLVQIGFGITWGIKYLDTHILSITFTGGYPFWGGLCFITSGALSVSKVFFPCLIRGSLGMNIVSCIFALTGVILLAVDMYIDVKFQQSNVAVFQISRNVISPIVFIFSILEFCIASVTTHFARQSISNVSLEKPFPETVVHRYPGHVAGKALMSLRRRPPAARPEHAQAQYEHAAAAAAAAAVGDVTTPGAGGPARCWAPGIICDGRSSRSGILALGARSARIFLFSWAQAPGVKI